MPARDIYHLAVRHSLEKEGWTVTDDPYTLRAGGFLMYIDLGWSVSSSLKMVLKK